MTAPGGLTRLAPPAGLLSPAPSATLSPPLSESGERPDNGGRLRFFKDGRCMLELEHGPSEGWEKKWVAVATKTFWPPATVAAPVDNIQGWPDSRHWRRPGAGRDRRKQATPCRRPSQPGFSVRRGRPAAEQQHPAAAAAAARRISRRPCRPPEPAGRPGGSGGRRGSVPPPAAAAAARTGLLATTVSRLAERCAAAERKRRPSGSRGSGGAARQATSRKRPGAGRGASRRPAAPAPAAAPSAPPLPLPAPSGTLSVSPAARGARHSTPHSIDWLLASPGRPPTEQQQQRQLVTPTPLRPAPALPYLPPVYPAYPGYGGADLCVVPPPAGYAPFPLVSPLLFAQLSRSSVFRPVPVLPRQEPAAPPPPPPPPLPDPYLLHATAEQVEPLNLSKR